jgi:hypothetical protein
MAPAVPVLAEMLSAEKAAQTPEPETLTPVCVRDPERAWNTSPCLCHRQNASVPPRVVLAVARVQAASINGYLQGTVQRRYSTAAREISDRCCVVGRYTNPAPQWHTTVRESRCVWSPLSSQLCAPARCASPCHANLWSTTYTSAQVCNSISCTDA